MCCVCARALQLVPRRRRRGWGEVGEAAAGQGRGSGGSVRLTLPTGLSRSGATRDMGD